MKLLFMKKVILSFAICFFTVATNLAQEQNIEVLDTVSLNWEPTFKLALKKSKKEKKPVLI